MVPRRTVRIDSLPESAWRYSGYDAIVCVDVLVSATTIVTAVVQGRRVTLAADMNEAAALAATQESPILLSDELSGGAIQGARLGGPAFVSSDGGLQPLVLVSPFATMLADAAKRARVYVACLRNFEATANELSLQHKRVVVIGAGHDGEVCAADQMATAWLALRMQGRDFDLEGRNTTDEVARWASSDVSLIGLSRSAERLRGLGRGPDVDFVLRHVNDLNVVCVYESGEVHDPVARRRKLEEETPTPAWGTPGVGATRYH